MAKIPLMVEMAGKKTVIIGGGRVAEKRARMFIEKGASLHVVSPEATEMLRAWASRGLLVWEQKFYDASDLVDVDLLVVATNDAEENQRIVEDAVHVPLVNAAFEADQANVHFPSFLNRGRLTIAVSTDGASPPLAEQMKQELLQEYGEEFEDYLDFLYECRQKIKQAGWDQSKKRSILNTLLDQKYLHQQEQEAFQEWIKEEEYEWINREACRHRR